MKRYLLCSVACVSLASAAHADDSLTIHGITLYGTVDIGLAYQTHGAPSSDFLPTGIEYNAYGSKNLRNGQFSVAPSGLSQSKIGIRGSEELIEGWSGIFKVETGFDPNSGNLTDGPKSLALNNGIAANRQISAGDSSRAGQALNGPVYAGVTNQKYGTLTFGRQNTLLLDNVVKYDPMGGSYAFSLLGYTGAMGGGGDTEDGRLDNSLVYANRFGPLRLGLGYRFGATASNASDGEVWQVGVGTDYQQFSLDANFARVKDAVTAGSLTAAQIMPGVPVTAATATQLPTSQLPGTLAGTISDNTAYAVMASYTLGKPKLFVGYENITYENPSRPLVPGSDTIGGYILGVVSNTAYTSHRVWQIAWTGMKYSFTPDLDLTGAYYHIDQNSYKVGGSCSNTSAASCSGQYNGVSLMADYKVSKRFDVYGGAMWSQIVGGLGSGALHNNTIDPMLGVRFNF